MISKEFAYDWESVHGLEEFDALKKKVVFEESNLSQRQKDLIAAVVSRLNGSKLCTVAHATMASRRAQDPAAYKMLVQDFRASKLDAADRAMLEYVEKLTTNPGSIENEDLESLREHGFSDNGIVEMILTAGVMGIVNRLRLGTLCEMPKGVAAAADRLGM